MKSIEIIMQPVKDRQKSKEFYRNLGFEVIVEAPGPHGDTWIQMGLPGCSTTLAMADFPGIICETNNIEEESETLRANGIDTGKIHETPWGKFAWFKDLDGNSLCLHEKK